MVMIVDADLRGRGDGGRSDSDGGSCRDGQRRGVDDGVSIVADAERATGTGAAAGDRPGDEVVRRANGDIGRERSQRQ